MFFQHSLVIIILTITEFPQVLPDCFVKTIFTVHGHTVKIYFLDVTDGRCWIQRCLVVHFMKISPFQCVQNYMCIGPIHWRIQCWTVTGLPNMVVILWFIDFSEISCWLTSVVFCWTVCAVWDQTKLSRFSWICYDVSTYQHYSDETTYENSLVYQGSTLQLSSLTHVMNSLTHNARQIFLLLVKHQLASDDSGSYIGISWIHVLCLTAVTVTTCQYFHYCETLTFHCL